MCMKKTIKVPSHVKKLIWWGKADPIKGRKQLITQIFNRGDVKDMRWALKFYPKRVLRDAVKNPLKGHWDSRSLGSFTNYFRIKLSQEIAREAIQRIS